VPDNLAELGKLTLRPEANIIKLPNISASVAQLKAAIKELQARATPCPTFPRARRPTRKRTSARYNKCIGSAVNPVLREGNSDRRAPRAVKEYARKHPHSMAEWSQASRTHVSHMHDGDFYHGEKSMTLDKARDVKMELITKSGKTIVLKPKVSLLDREVIDSMFMSKKALLDFYEKQIEDAQDRRDVLAARQGHHDEGLAPHRVRPLRAIFYKEAFAKHAKLFASWASTSTTAWSICTTRSPACPRAAGRDQGRPARLPRAPPRAGHGRLGQGHHQLPLAQRHRRRLHARHDPQRRQDVGRRRPPEGRQGRDARVTFARIYQEMINFCKWHGASTPRPWAPCPTSA
jgi:isocitrate dehydrogenase